VRCNRKAKDLGTVMQNIKKEVSSTVILPSGYIDYWSYLQDQQQSFKELLLILMASCLLVLCFIISISKFKSGFHPVVYFRFGYFWSYLLLF
jgi:Cu/Ag efflux pump CusA